MRNDVLRMMLGLKFNKVIVFKVNTNRFLESKAMIENIVFKKLISCIARLTNRIIISIR